MSMPNARGDLNLAIDIGAQFADLAVNLGGHLCILKHPVSNHTEATAALAAIDAAQNRFGFAVSDLASVRIGSTGALNAVLQRKGARIALLATEGFTDTFFLARQNRRDLYDPVAKSCTPDFLLAEADVHPVSGRIGSNSAEVAPPDLAALAQIAQRLRDDGVEAVAVCLLFAHLNPAHELACLNALREHCPGVPVSLSHRVDPHPREYERTISVCLDAWLKPQFMRFNAELTTGLDQRGFAGQLLFGDSRAALMSAEVAELQPAATLASGPAAAAGFAATVTALGPARPRLIMDLGSVSCDLSFAPADVGSPLVTAAVYGDIPLRCEMLDLHSLSLGARHVAVWHPDEKITFEVRDGASGPTLEQALCVCGRVAPMVTGDDLRPLKVFARQAGWTDARDGAQRIITAAALELAAAILNFSVRRNIDPAQAQLVAIGGLGPLLATDVAELLSVREVILPEAPAVAGALGLLNAAPRFEATTAIGQSLADVTPKQLAQLYNSAAQDIAHQTDEFGTIKLDAPTVVLTMAATAQMHPMQIEMTPPPQTCDEIATAFHAAYQARYAIVPPAHGHVFSLTLRRDGSGAPTAFKTPHSATQDANNPERYETAAGTLHVPPNWQLTPATGGYYSLRIREQSK